MAKVMISLLGGRPVPNILAVLQLKPDYLYIVTSEDSLGNGGNYEKAIRALPTHLIPSAPNAVKPYVLEETVQQCIAIADQHKEDQIIITSASEPKTMGFGAYDFAQRLRKAGRDIDMCYLSREGLVWVFRSANIIEPVSINLKDYFTSYGWNVTLKTNKGNEELQKLVPILIDSLPTSHNLLHTLRSNDKGKGKRTLRFGKPLDDASFSRLQQIEQIDIVSNVRRTTTETKWTINSDKDARSLLTGDWLEFYVFQEASSLINLQHRLLFDECGWGVEDKSGKGEIDFAGIFGGQMIIASCKTEDSIKRVWFEELHSKAEQLGKGMCSTLLISSVSKNTRREQEVREYEKWADERQIVLVMAEDIPHIAAILRKIAVGNRDAEPKHIHYYARM